VSTLMRFLCNESGATAIEYGLIAAGIAVVIVAVMQGAGVNLNTTFGQRADRPQVRRLVASGGIEYGRRRRLGWGAFIRTRWPLTDPQ
jgi:pilus assembly protein Flp/PilA